MKNNFQSNGKGRSQRVWQLLISMLFILTMGIGQMWGADITVTPPTPNNASNPFSTGLYVMSFSGTGSKLSSGAITTGTKGAVITINFQATKSDMYIKTITFNSLGNGTLSSDDGTFDGQLFTATGNKNSVNVVLTSGSGQKGTVKVTNVVVNTGTNVVETITFTGVDSGDGQKATFTSSVATSALSSITTDASAFSVSSGKLSWTNGKKVILTAESNIKYVAFSIADGKMYPTFSATEDTYNSANYSWSGSSKTVTLTNGSGGGREIKGLYVIIDPVVKHHVTYSLGGDYGTTPTQADVVEGAKFTLHNGTTGITAPSGQQFAGWNDGTTTYAGGAEYTMGTSDVTLTAVWENAKTDPTATFSNSAYEVGAAALDLSTLWSSNSDGAVTYALKVASEDATVSGTSFSATKAGSYVVVATQAADANYKAVEKEATITVTWPATGAATIIYNLDVTNNGTTLQTLATTNANSSSISVSASNSLLAGGLGTGGSHSADKNKHNGTRTLGINTLAEETADKYFNVTFTVASGYEFTPSAISLKTLTIGGNATSYKAVLTDGVNSIVGTVNATNDSEVTLGSWTGLGTTTLSGTVTLKLYAWYTTSGTYNAYRLSTPITITGTVAAEGACTAPTDVTISATGGAAHIVGDAVTLTASANNVSATTKYTWYKGATLEAAKAAGAIQTAATAATGGTTYSIASCELESAGKYWCVVWNAEGCETSASLDLTVSATYTVNYYPGEGSGPLSIVDAAATVVADCPSAFIAPAGKVFNGWKDGDNNDVAVGATVTSNMALTAQWSEVVCPTAGTGDVVFSWTPKSGTVSAEYIAAGGRNLAPYMESVVGGSITGYAQNIDETTTTLYKNTNNHIYFNGNSAYIKVDLCELAEGDKLLVTGQANNMWVSTSADRPADAASAAAVLVPGEAFYVPSASALIGKSTIYIFREADFTEVASLTITRPQKFTATYAAPDLTAGDVPAAVSDIFDGQKITLADQGTMVKGELVFHGWNDGTQTYAAGADYTVGANVTLTAVWKKACPVSGEVYSLTVKSATYSVPTQTETNMVSDYATVTGGEAYIGNSHTSDAGKAQVTTTGNGTVYFGGANGYIKVVLECDLQANDVISFENGSGSNQISFTTAATRATSPATTSNTWTVTSAFATDVNANSRTFYIWRASGSATYLHSLTITRPAPDASVPTIDASTPADASYAAADPISAMTVTADAVAPKDLHYQWYKEAGETDIEVGTDAASYTPTASGEYYCVVTNSPSGYTPKSATSRKATITMISSDATLAWLKAGGNDIALSDGVYAYEYVIADNATVAPTITAGKNEEHASVTITQADSKTGTATIHVVAQDGSTSHDYTVKFNEFSGCLTTFYFPYAQDAADNHVTNNAPLRGYTVFTTTQTNSSSYSGTLTVGDVDYPATKSTGSAANFGNLVVPDKYTATLYLLFRTGGSNCSVQLARAGETPTPYMTSDAYASQGVYQYNFENVQAGTYVIRVVKSNGDVQNSQYIAMAAELCRYEVSSVSLANMTLRTGNTATPEMTITPAKGAVVSQAWSFVNAAAAEAAGLSINATTGAVTATDGATPGAYTVKVVLNDDNALSATCTVTVITEFSQVDVTGTTVWNFATGKAASSKITIENEDIILANADGITNDETFNSQALRVNVKYVSNSQLQGKSIMFHTTVPGLLTVRYACTSDKSGVNRVLYINDRATTSQTDNAEVTYTQVVPAGDVTIKAIFDDGGTPTVDLMNYKYIEFKAASELNPADADGSTLGGYERNVTEGRYGTICLPNGGVMVGASVFEIAYMDYKDNKPFKIYFDEIANGTMVAGRPYIFLPNESVTRLGVFYTDAAGADAGNYRGLYGSYSEINLTANDGNYILLNNMYYYVNSYNVYCSPNRAYIKLADVPDYDPGKPAYGRRRVALDVHSEQVATGIGNTELSEQPMKVMINGQLYILRGEQMFDATGRLVK